MNQDLEDGARSSLMRLVNSHNPKWSTVSCVTYHHEMAPETLRQSNRSEPDKLAN